MPVYSYQCPACETVHEKIRRMSEIDDPVTCEAGCVFVPTTHTGAEKGPAEPLKCKRIISLPAQPTFVGASPKEQRYEAIKTRHENYVASDKFREAKREQIYKLYKKGTITPPSKK